MEIDAREIHDEGAEDPDLQCDFISADEQLDLGAWMQDAVGLEFPTPVLCGEDCKGLCPNCGVNWNEQSCGLMFWQDCKNMFVNSFPFLSLMQC